jgi:dihydrofolate reductase
MRQLIVTEFITLDGVVDSPGGGDHPHAGWTFKDVELDEAAYDIKDREQKEAGALLLGRVSYEEFAPVWPSMEEFAEYNAMPKYVVSSALTDPTWHNTTVLRSLD